MILVIYIITFLGTPNVIGTISANKEIPSTYGAFKRLGSDSTEEEKEAAKKYLASAAIHSAIITGTIIIFIAILNNATLYKKKLGAAKDYAGAKYGAAKQAYQKRFAK